jgi:hypothetical protein
VLSYRFAQHFLDSVLLSFEAERVLEEVFNLTSSAIMITLRQHNRNTSPHEGKGAKNQFHF